MLFRQSACEVQTSVAPRLAIARRNAVSILALLANGFLVRDTTSASEAVSVYSSLWIGTEESFWCHSFLTPFSLLIQAAGTLETFHALGYRIQVTGAIIPVTLRHAISQKRFLTPFLLELPKRPIGFNASINR